MNVRFEFYQPQTLQDMTVNVSTEIGSATKAAAMGALNAAPLIDAAIATDTASGSIASFEDGAEGLDLKSATIQIVPKQSGSGDPSPSNVRPISGWDSIGVTACGKNLLKNTLASVTKQGLTYTVNADGSVTVTGTATANSYVAIPINQTYPVDVIASGAPSGNTAIYTQTTTSDGNKNETGAGVTITAGTTINEMRLRINNGTTANVTFYPMLRLASDTDTTYEPYKATTHTLPLPSTIYGGQAVYEGNGMWTVTATHGYITFNGSEAWGWSSVSERPHIILSLQKKYSQLTTNMYPYSSKSQAVDRTCTTNGGSGNDIWIKDSTNAPDLASWITFLASNPLQVVYELATPQTYTLTTSDLIKTLRGANNIWADTGDISVEYRADVGLYIDKLTGSTETDMVADANIPANTYFMVGNQLYRSTSAIAAGATIVPGTNCTAMTLTEALQPLIGTTETVTPQQVMQAVEEGRSVVLSASWTFGDMPLTLTFTSFNRATDNVASGGYLDIVISQTIIVVNGTWYAVELIGGTEFGTGRNWTVFATMLATD